MSKSARDYQALVLANNLALIKNYKAQIEVWALKSVTFLSLCFSREALNRGFLYFT